MKTFLLIIFLIIFIFDCFMITPFGALWILKNLDENKPCYGILIVFITIIPVSLIGCYLGIF